MASSPDIFDHHVLIAAARSGLPLGPTATVRLSPNDGALVVQLARADHLSGFVANAITNGEIVAEDEIIDEIIASWHEELLACVAIEALLVRTAALLDSGGVRWQLTKGPGLAHLDYPNASIRTFGDLDLVIHQDSWRRTTELLAHDGSQREADGLGVEFDERYGKGATYTTHDGFEVDLHRRLCVGRFAVSAQMDQLFEDQSSITLGGQAIPVLSGPHRLLHACHHAALGGFTHLRALRDVAQLVLVSRVDWDSTFEIARTWRASPVVAAAVLRTWDKLRLDPGHPIVAAARIEPTGILDRRALRIFEEGRPFRSKALTAIGRLSWTRTPHYLWTLGANRRRRWHR